MKLIVAALLLAGVLGGAAQAGDAWLSWTAARAEAIGKAAYVRGRVGGIFDTRILKTERAYNYKLAATWLNAEAIRATARMLQLADRLSDDEARTLVAEAESAGGTVVIVEIDPREGSGVIPTDWSAFLQPVMPGEVAGKSVRGVNTPALREVKALAGVVRRNYDYDRFWVVFPLKHADGAPVIPGDAVAVELVVRISGREGHVRWPAS
ncbi:MAG: hypothetical protein ABI665_20225 [Vicinamibacterales bacterium]